MPPPPPSERDLPADLMMDDDGSNSTLTGGCAAAAGGGFGFGGRKGKFKRRKIPGKYMHQYGKPVAHADEIACGIPWQQYLNADYEKISATVHVDEWLGE